VLFFCIENRFYFQLVGGTGVGRSPCGTGFIAGGVFGYSILLLLLLNEINMLIFLYKIIHIQDARGGCFAFAMALLTKETLPVYILL
jgi:hypothetical protein